MSIFDTIADGITSIFDSVDTYDLIKGATKGYNAFMDKEKAENSSERDLLRFLERNSRDQDVDGTWDKKNAPRESEYGAKNFSADYTQIQREWLAYLTGIADTKTVPGERYRG